ncbi:MAG: hypothetical protein ABI378_08005 [Chitinophagaceae bacterium]
MKNIKYILCISSALLFLYVVISWFLLDGHFIYYTSFNESTIAASKKEDLFVSDDLKITSQGDSLINWKKAIDVWTNRRYKIKYFGILFHWTYTNQRWRYLNIGFKNELYPHLNNWCMKNSNEQRYVSCCDRISCNVGDTIKTDFYKCKDGQKLGTLKVIVK